MRITIACIAALALAAGCSKKHDHGEGAAAAPNAAQWIQSLSGMGDAACACNNNRECVARVRDQWEQNKRAMQDVGKTFTGADATAFQAALLKLRQCGDAAGVTIWVDQQ